MEHLIEYIRKHKSNALLEEEIDDDRFVFFSDFFDVC